MSRHFKKIVEEISEDFMQQNKPNLQQQLRLNIKEFADKVAAFNRLGEALYNGGNFSKLAEELEEIASHAEAYTLRETDGQWFDQVTIKRNMKELKGYTGEFKKVAGEARALQERMTALYEDCGRVLGRYFEIKEMGQPDGLTTEPQKSEDELQVNARAGLREGQLCEKCGLPMEQCECKMREGTACEECERPTSECQECKQVNEAEKWIQKAVNPAHKGYCTPMSKPTCTPRRKALARRFKKGIDKEGVVNEGNKCSICGKPSKENTYGNPKYCQGHSQSELAKLRKQQQKTEGVMKLKKLMEDVNSDYPNEDWVKLDVPMLKYDVALEFEKDLKKKGFDVKRHDWKERAAQGEEFSEFFVKLKDFDKANEYAVGAYPSYDNNARMDKK